MNKIYNKYFDETYYTETLKNGLKVIIFHKPEFSTSICCFGTPYGGLNIHQKVGSKVYNFNPGIAHFLEHKLFEAKGDDMLNQFSSMGARLNAFTSYKETVYYFATTNNDIEKPLNLLLDFVQDLDITDKSVKKEKGIIAQEVAMYQQMPDQRLLAEAYKCLYHNFPLKYDIGGDKKSVYAITRNELETCYGINYHPANMTLCITTPLDPKSIIKIVRTNQENKKFSKFIAPKVNNEPEPNPVFNQKKSFSMPIKTNKHIYAYKIKPNFKDQNDAFKKEWSLRLLLEIYFSSINPDYQSWLDNNIINDFFGYEVEFSMDYANVLFYIENDDSKVLKNLILDTLDKNLLNEEVIEQLKHRFIGEMFETFNDVVSFNQSFIRDYLQGLDYFKALEDLKNISLSDIEEAKEYLNSPHISMISMIKK